MKFTLITVIVSLVCIATGLMLCTFNPAAYDMLTISRADSLGDTVSVFPTLKFAFSEQIEDSVVMLELQPNENGYHTVLNETFDTLTFVVTGMLQGNTEYTLSSEHKVTGISGEIMQAGAPSLKFFTYAREREPNDFKDTSHQLIDPVFGDVFNTNDTDFFYIPKKSSNPIYLKSHTPGVAFALGLSDYTGRDTLLSAETDAVKYLALDSGFTAPMFLRVYSLVSQGKYELGITGN